ncbi:hypothetical protein HZC30_02410 [Candidatus Woesearchaeota archaeon]|nr:hypothetical protein [Candidatus Woesearchaeota archaeon]
MGFLGKLAFWKKEDDFGFDHLVNQDMTHPGTDANNPFGTTLGQEPASDPLLSGTSSPLPSDSPASVFPAQRSPIYPQQPAEPVSAPLTNTLSSSRDMELLNTKLENIRLMLNSIDQRLANLEKGEHKPSARLW